MIVATYNSSDNHGGAARAAFRLNAALRSAGMEAFFFCRHKQTRDPFSIRLTERRSELPQGLKRLEAFWSETGRNFLISENRTGLSSTIFSVDPFGLDVTEAPVAAIARIHHLHWCSNFISPASIRFLREAGRPIFITLHDQWWMTGGCHYSAGCTKYEADCAQCPQLFSDPAGLTETALSEKIDAFAGSDVTVVTPSQWMADCARNSTVFRNADVQVVRNPIDVDVFTPPSPTERADARAELGLEEDDVVLLFGAQTLSDRRKGFNELVQALKLVNDRIKRRLFLVSFGRPAKHTLSVAGIPAIELGEIFDDRRLAQIYGAADLFVIPSLEDNYPNTIVESLACGTPAVGYAAGGISDLIDDKITGVTAKPVGDVPALADAIIAGIENFTGSDQIREACRNAVADSHHADTIAAQMIGLYSEKAADFHAPINEEEKFILAAAVARNKSGRSTFATLDAGSSVFNSEAAMRVLLPLLSVHEKAEARRAAELKEKDLTLHPGELCPIGRGRPGMRILGDGWAEPFLDGVWTNTGKSHLHFFVEAGETVRSVEILVSAPKDGRQTFSIKQDREILGDFDIEGPHRRKIEIPLSPITGPQFVNITFEFPEPELNDPEQEDSPPQKIFVSGFTVLSDEAAGHKDGKSNQWLRRLTSFAFRENKRAARNNIT